MGTWENVRAEREDLIAFLTTLTPEQWDAQTLCSEWKVRHVVGHLVSVTDRPTKFFGPLLKAGFNFNKASANDAIQRGSADPAELLDQLRAAVPSTRKPPGTKDATVLADTMVHTQDIRRPLDRPRQIPEARLVEALEYAKGVGFPMGTKKRIAGLTLRATDVDWSTGSGPEVTGTGEALMMMMAGRQVALDDLAGEGKATVAGRF